MGGGEEWHVYGKLCEPWMRVLCDPIQDTDSNTQGERSETVVKKRTHEGVESYEDT